MTARLDDTCRALVSEAVDRHGSIRAVALMIGYARPSLSLALAGRYSGSLDAMEAAIRDRLTARVDCPHLACEIAADECRSHRERPIPTAEPSALKHWRACRFCPRNPDTKETTHG